MAPRIRPATRADIPAMHALRRAVHENRLSDLARVTEASYAPYVDAGTALVAIDAAEAIAGFGVLDPANRSIWALFVHPDSEGAGVGRSLHGALLDLAAALGIDHLWLVTGKATRAEHFYTNAGWQACAASDASETRFERRLDPSHLTP